MKESEGISVLIVSVRNLRKQAANSILYEFEDLIQDFHDVTIFAPTSEHVLNRKVFRSVKKLSSSNRLAHSISRYPAEDVLDKHYDLILVVADNVYQLHLLNHVKGWRNSKAKKACYLAELWPGSLEDSSVLREPFLDYDHIFVGFSHALPVLREKVGVSCSYLPVGVDTDIFSKSPPNSKRPIDIAYLGRRRPAIHNQLLQVRDLKNKFYTYDTSIGLEVEDHIEHRQMYADILKRSKCAIAYPAKMNFGSYTKNVSETGWRYFEFAAAGTVIVGHVPANENFELYFGWKDSVINVADKSIESKMNDLLADEAHLMTISQLNRMNSLLKNDWVYRWLDILSCFSFDAPASVLSRIERLKSQASSLA